MGLAMIGVAAWMGTMHGSKWWGVARCHQLPAMPVQPQHPCGGRSGCLHWALH